MRSNAAKALAALVVLLPACRRQLSAPPKADVPPSLGGSGFEPLLPIPAETPEIDPRIVALGERLYSDRRLSSNGKVACETCHDLTHGAASEEAFPVGDNGKPVALNPPSLFNLPADASYGWFGLNVSIDAQVGDELAAPERMGLDAKSAVQKLSSDAALMQAFDAAFPSGGLNEENLKCALADFVRSLSSPNSKLDRWLKASTEAEKSAAMPWIGGELGYVEFKTYGCASCHQGVAIGGNLLSKMNLRDATVYETNGDEREEDPGRFAFTKIEDDRHVIRVPSLRNVACTAPYFHDGSVSSLEEAIQIEAVRQVGHKLNKEQVSEIATFLRALTGEYKGKPL